jgi:hypothetical protein
MKMHEAIHYRRRAEELLRLGDVGIDPESMAWARHVSGLSTESGDGLCPNAAGLLYVHAAIALTDAMLVFLTGARSTAQDHAEAAARLQKECGKRQRPSDGVKHFRWLVRKKDFFAYDNKHVSLDSAKEAQTKVQRFLAWAFDSFPEIAANA